MTFDGRSTESTRLTGLARTPETPDREGQPRTSSLNPPWDPAEQPTISVRVAGRALGLSSAASYRAAARGVIPTIKIGERTMRVPTVRMLRVLGFDRTNE